MESAYWLIIGSLIVVVFFIVLLIIEQFKTKKIIFEKLLIKDNLIKVLYRSKNSPRLIFNQKTSELITINVDNLLTIKRKTIYSSFVYIEGFVTLLLFGGAFRGLSQLINNDYNSLGGILLVLVIFMLSVLILTLTVIKYSKYSILHLKLSKNSQQFRYLNLYFHIKSDSTLLYNLLKNENNNNLRIDFADFQK